MTGLQSSRRTEARDPTVQQWAITEDWGLLMSSVPVGLSSSAFCPFCSASTTFSM